MRPAPRLFWLISGWLAWAALASLWPTLVTPWMAGGIALLLFVVLDGLRVRRQTPPRITRKAAHALPVGVWREVSLEIDNPLSQQSVVRVFDHYPSACDMEGLPLTFTLAPQTRVRAAYRLRFTERGEHSFAGIEALIDSPFGLLRRRVFIEAPYCARVYPNFAAVAKYALLATDNRLSQIGVRQRRRRGEGLSFHQLREYREGDTPRQIDWKATARVNKLISREYQDERDQQIMFLLDCGNRMRAREDDGSLSHFDEALNALLLLAHVALRQGDAVGCLSFGHDTRLIPARKGHAALNHLMERLFDLEPGSNSPDYRSAATHIAKTVRKRSLVLILTNLRDEDDEELRDAIEVLRRRHLVLLASLRETAVQRLIELPRNTFETALEAAAALEYISIRSSTIERLKRSGAHVLDVTPSALPIALVNRYLDFKSSGVL
ncbi:MAG: DUF58 domain-containing protein [Betaproteobacteria bacterium]|nr:DUF58 domain-containing protein [Betaproteobacteria bacterium]